MIQRRELLLVVAVVTALAVTLGTGGVSSISADRGVDVAVAEDDHAYLGFEQNATQVKNDTTTLEVTVRNQFPAQTSLSQVVVATNGTTVDLAENGRFESGTSSTHTFQSVPCDETVTVTASSSDVDVQFERAVSCS